MWTSGAIKPELLADKYWLPVLSALHKANLLPEVFPLAPRLGKLVLLESDAEIVLHHLIGVAATAESVSCHAPVCFWNFSMPATLLRAGPHPCALLSASLCLPHMCLFTPTDTFGSWAPCAATDSQKRAR